MPMLIPYKTTQIQSLNSTISAELLINMISSERAPNSYSALPLLHAMGTITRATLTGKSSLRGEVMSDDQTLTYIVADNKFLSINVNNTVSSALGTLSSSTGVVDMVCDRLYVFIIDITNTVGYYYNILTSTFGTISAGVFTALTNYKKAIYLNGFFGIITSTTESFSEPGDPTSWFSDRQNSANHTLTTGVIASNKLILPGTSICEFWLAPANPTNNFPIQFQVSRQYGCISPLSIASNQNTAYWIGTNKGRAMLLSSSFDDVLPVGNEDFDNLLQEMQRTSTITDIEGFCYEDRGMVFYHMTCPTANKTYLFNISHKIFSQLMLANGNYIPIRGYSGANNKHLVITPGSNKVYELSNQIYQYDGGDAPRTIISYTLYHDDNVLRMPLFRVHLDTSSYASNQTWSCAMSYDGGITYATALTDTTVKSTSGYMQFNRFSAGTKLTTKITYTGNYPVCINNYTGVLAISGRSAGQ